MVVEMSNRAYLCILLYLYILNDKCFVMRKRRFSMPISILTQRANSAFAQGISAWLRHLDERLRRKRCRLGSQCAQEIRRTICSVTRGANGINDTLRLVGSPRLTANRV